MLHQEFTETQIGLWFFPGHEIGGAPHRLDRFSWPQINLRIVSRVINNRRSAQLAILESNARSMHLHDISNKLDQIKWGSIN